MAMPPTGFRTFVEKNFPWFTQSTKEEQAWSLHNAYEDDDYYYRDSAGRKDSDDPIPSRARHMAAASGASNAVVDRMRNNPIGKYAPLGLQEAIGDTLAFTAGAVNELDYFKAAKQDGIIDATDRLFQDIGANYAGSFGYDRQSIAEALSKNGAEPLGEDVLDSFDSTGQIYNDNYLGFDPDEYNQLMESMYTNGSYDMAGNWIPSQAEKDYNKEEEIYRQLSNSGLIEQEPYNIWNQYGYDMQLEQERADRDSLSRRVGADRF